MIPLLSPFLFSFNLAVFGGKTTQDYTASLIESHTSLSDLEGNVVQEPSLTSQGIDYSRGEVVLLADHQLIVSEVGQAFIISDEDFQGRYDKPLIDGKGSVFWATELEPEPEYLNLETGELLTVEEKTLLIGSDANAQEEEYTQPERSPAASPKGVAEGQSTPKSPTLSQISDMEGQREPEPLDSAGVSALSANLMLPEEQEVETEAAASSDISAVHTQERFSVLENLEEAKVEIPPSVPEDPALPEESSLPPQEQPEAPVEAAAGKKKSKNKRRKNAADLTPEEKVKRFSMDRAFDAVAQEAKELGVKIGKPSSKKFYVPKLKNLKRSSPFPDERTLLHMTPSSFKANNKVVMLLDPLAGSMLMFKEAKKRMAAALEMTTEDPSLAIPFLFAFGNKEGKARNSHAKGFISDHSLFFSDWDERVTRLYLTGGDQEEGFRTCGFLVTASTSDAQLENLMANMDSYATIAVQKNLPLTSPEDKFALLEGTGDFESLIGSDGFAQDTKKSAALVRKVVEQSPGESVWVLRRSEGEVLMHAIVTPSNVMRVVFMGPMNEESQRISMFCKFDGNKFFDSFPDGVFRGPQVANVVGRQC